MQADKPRVRGMTRKAVFSMDRMKKATIWLVLVMAVCGFMLGFSARAGEGISGPVPWVSMIQGDEESLYVKQPDSDWFAATVNTPFGEGDQLWQERGGRSEIYFERGTFLRLDGETGVILDELSDSRIRVILTKGLAELGNGGKGTVLLDTPGQTVIVDKGGRVKAVVDDYGNSEITVRRGRARAESDRGVVRVESGQRLVTGPDGSIGRLSRDAAYDDFDRWCDRREAELANAAVPPAAVANYMPEPVVASLAGNGVWVNDPYYGWVWRPRVMVGWAPYRVGRWVYRPVWGWTWVSYEPWGWYPYHYGRWVMLSTGWAWAPVYLQVGWSPALVFWLEGPDYIAWHPVPYGMTMTMVWATSPVVLVERYVYRDYITVVSYQHFHYCNYHQYARPWPGRCVGSCHVVRGPDHIVRHDEAIRVHRTPRPNGYLPRTRMPEEHRIYAHHRDATPSTTSRTPESRLNYGNGRTRPVHDPGRTANLNQPRNNPHYNTNRPARETDNPRNLGPERSAGHQPRETGNRPSTDRPNSNRPSHGRDISPATPGSRETTRPTNPSTRPQTRPNTPSSGHTVNPASGTGRAARPQTRPETANTPGNRVNTPPPSHSEARPQERPTTSQPPANRPQPTQPNPDSSRKKSSSSGSSTPDRTNSSSTSTSSAPPHNPGSYQAPGTSTRPTSSPAGRSTSSGSSRPSGAGHRSGNSSSNRR